MSATPGAARGDNPCGKSRKLPEVPGMRDSMSHHKVFQGRWMVLLALAGLGVAGCSKPPAAEIEVADAAITAAVGAGAEEYAAGSLGSVRDLRAQLDSELALQGGKSSLTRSYDHALELATQVTTAANAAASEAAASKEAVRQETTALLEQVRVALTEVQGMLAAAPRGKGTAMDLAALQADLDAASTSLLESETALEEGRYLEAKTKVVAVQHAAQSVKTAIETATQAQVVRRSPGS